MSRDNWQGMSPWVYCTRRDREQIEMPEDREFLTSDDHEEIDRLREVGRPEGAD